MDFIPRLTRPEAGNKYYITKSNGGYSDAIVGKPTDSLCNVLANCVGYAYGRFNEIGQWGYMKYLRPVNAELFPQYRGDCKIGQTPAVGAIMVWQKGTLNADDGAGHVAVVEKVISDTQVITSESGYNTTPCFWTKTRNKGSDGNWGAGAAYKFVCFIYNPAPCCGSAPAGASTQTASNNVATVPKVWDGKLPTLSKGMTGKTVRVLQILLNDAGCSCGTADGVFGGNTRAALVSFQSKNGLSGDGVCGSLTWGKLLGIT